MSAIETLRSNTFRSLRVRNFRLFFGGMLVSMAGTWMQTLALSWLVLQLAPGNAGIAIGLVIACQYLPTLLFGMYGGVLADAFDKRLVLAVSQAAQAVVAILLAVLTAFDVIELWMVVVIVLVNGFALLVDNPTRSTLVSELVGDDDFPNALGLTGALMQTSRIAGPALGGVLVVTVGVAACFAVNAVSFVAVIVALALMRGSELHRRPPRGRMKGQLSDGLRYIWRKEDLRAALLAMAVIGTLSFNMTVMLPLMVKDVFGGTAATLSWMTIALSCGALVGALVFATRSIVTPLFMVLTGAAFGALLLGAALAPTLAVFLGLLVVTGLFQTTFLTSSNSIIQLRADQAMRGRVMAVYTITVVGSLPIGGPLLGLVSQAYGPRWGLAVEAAGAFFAMAVFGVMFLRACRREGRAYELAELPDSDHVVVAPAPVASTS